MGALGDLGWYNIRLALWAMRWQLPTIVRANAHKLSPSGVPIDCSVELVFGEGPVMQFDCSFCA